MWRFTAVAAAAVMILSGASCIGSSDEHRFASADLDTIFAENDLAPDGTAFDATISGDFGLSDVDYYSEKQARRLEKFNFTSGRSVSFMPDSDGGDESASAEGYLFRDSSDAEGYFSAEKLRRRWSARHSLDANGLGDEGFGWRSGSQYYFWRMNNLVIFASGDRAFVDALEARARQASA